ncbi:MAG: polysaccharide deacetylase family protein [Bacteroidales bacterium]|nr:polysaccharide deacetylase family protein [Bacteroidales bacterium]
MYFVKTPIIFTKLFNKSLIWKIPNDEKKIYLTFDDGPTPELTVDILKYLTKYKAKATFFCVGDNIRKHPELIKEIQNNGHKIGHHTYNHISGWNTSTKAYIENVNNGHKLLDSNLFRPAYGRITLSQIKKLRLDYKIIMWSVLSGDFDINLSEEKCLKNALKAKTGDIVVFHDNIKSTQKIHEVLPRFLAHYTKLGYQFSVIEFKN